MNLTIYQINLERDTEAVAFESAERMEMIRHSPEIPSEIYDKVYQGSVDAEDLEDVYRIFNLEKPEDYRGRSMSVSDIVETVDPDTGAVSWHYCDLVGFKTVTFDPDKASE